MRKADSSEKPGARHWNSSRKVKSIRVVTKTEVKNTSKRQMIKLNKYLQCTTSKTIQKMGKVHEEETT